MEISRKSWAYRVWRWNNYGTPYDLCSFVRQMLWSFVKYTIKYTFLTIACAMCGTFLLFVILAPFLYAWFGIVELEAPAVVAYVMFCVGALIYFNILIGDAITDHRINRRKSYKQPGLVRSWYRAKKQKICPFITVTE